MFGLSSSGSGVASQIMNKYGWKGGQGGHLSEELFDTCAPLIISMQVWASQSKHIPISSPTVVSEFRTLACHSILHCVPTIIRDTLVVWVFILVG